MYAQGTELKLYVCSAFFMKKYRNYLSISKLQRLRGSRLGMAKLFHSTLHYGCNYLSMQGLKLIHVCERCIMYLFMGYSLNGGLRHNLIILQVVLKRLILLFFAVFYSFICYKNIQ